MLFTSLDDLPSTPCALTIGSFDGVHLGHQHLLQQAKEHGPLAVLTFTTHPSALFAPHAPTPLILPIPQRLHTLSQYGADIIIALPFTQALANTPYDQFLLSLHQRLPFHSLILGEGATLGKDRAGTAPRLQSLGHEAHFTVTYISKKTDHHRLISSKAIRSLIQQGDLPQVSALLGRPYTLWYSPHLPGICLPPSGTYPILVRSRTTGATHPATALITGHTIHLTPPSSTSDIELIF